MCYYSSYLLPFECSSTRLTSKYTNIKVKIHKMCYYSSYLLACECSSTRLTSKYTNSILTLHKMCYYSSHLLPFECSSTSFTSKHTNNIVKYIKTLDFIYQVGNIPFHQLEYVSFLLKKTIFLHENP